MSYTRVLATGFVSLDSSRSGAAGSVTTDEFVSPGTELWINYISLVPGSGLTVHTLSGGKVVGTGVLPPGDQPRRRVTWGSGHGVAKGARVQLRFELSKGAKLFSWWIAEASAAAHTQT